MGSVEEISVTLPHPALQGADWADAWQRTLPAPYPSARAAAEAVFGNVPAWGQGLLKARNLLVAPFGLETGATDQDSRNRIGIFPVIAETPEQMIVGLNDKHLDFRCVLDLELQNGQQTVTLATIIKRHNALGRAYLATILPFHRLIIRSMLKRLG